MFSDVISVMIGGAVGSALRFFVGVLLPMPTVAGTAFPWPTFVVNVAGSFALGVVVALTAGHQILSRQHALLLGTGLCGGFTTFSTFSVESIGLIDAQRLDLVALYVISTVVSTLGAAWLGAVAARSIM